MNWGLAMAFGAVGGGIVEVINLWTRLTAWQQDRMAARKGNADNLPRWDKYIDPGPDVLVACTRLSLGALAGLLFHLQISGDAAAVAVGAAAPALLRQLGAMRSVSDRTAHHPPPFFLQSENGIQAEIDKSAVE